MTEQEYRRKDSELIQQINEYQIDSAEHQLQIAMNQKQMALLEVNRMDLYNQYHNVPEPPQRNLQGEVIKK